MYFHGERTADLYGELVSWNDNENASSDATNGVGMQSGHGLQALEIQERIWSFILTWSRILLKDVASLMDGEILTNLGPPSTPGDVSSLRIFALEALYRLPDQLDLVRLKAIATAERNAREDHLWCLREDPGYFAEILQEESEHRREMVRDIRGQEHPSLKKPGRQLFWNRVTEDVLVDSYFGFAIFDEIVRRIDDFTSQHAKHHDRMKAEGANVPEDLSMAFQKLCVLLSNMAAELIRHLLTGLFPSPPLRRFCAREPHSTWAATYRMPDRNQSHKRVMALFDVLFDARKLHLFGLHTLTGEIGRLMQTDSEVGALISPWIANRLSSLTVVSECLHQLHLYKPWSRKLENDAALNRITLERIDREVLKQWTPILKAKFERSQIYKYAIPTDGKFTYPIHRRRNKQNVEILRKAEANLDELWRIVDRHFKSNAEGKSQHDLIAHLLRKDRVIQRTPEWTRPENTRAPAEKEDYEYRPFSTLFHDVTKQVTGTFDHVTHFPETPKAKTRGSAT
ncbi:hypothetical protein E8E12_002572 [Didymella heteroderae]|uniref:Uncharacterized protein n=1 Tax=Didymella heteroderae TaxID=1769908 RepID=A0A9P4WGR3_9PLEO|nr:hypothetical protein E8E12_002572 [Didymella heteroderae]